MLETCQIPPAGWKCSRGAGHEGPCAASIDYPPVPRVETEVFELTVTRVRDFNAAGVIEKDEYSICLGNQLIGENLNWWEVDGVLGDVLTKDTHAAA